MFGLFLVLLTLAAIFGLWLLVCPRKSQDLIILALAFEAFAFLATISPNPWVSRVRHFALPLLVIALLVRCFNGFRPRGWPCFLWLVLLLWVYCASFWALDPELYLALKLKPTVIAVVLLLAGATFRTSQDVRKLITCLLPTAIFICLTLVMGQADTMTSIEGRMSVNGANQNGVSVIAGTALIFLVAFALHGTIIGWARYLVFVVVPIPMYYMLASGSRSGMLAAGACVGAIVYPYVMSKRRFLKVGLPVSVSGMIAVYFVLRRTLSDVIGRMFDFSHYTGREAHWEELRYAAVGDRFWYGAGGQSIWTEYQPIWVGMLNIYYDIFYDTGMLGVIWLVICLWVTARKGWKVWFATMDDPMRFIMCGFVFYGLLHGIGESSALRGGSYSSFFLMVGLGMLSAYNPKDQIHSGGRALGHAYWHL